MNNCSFASSDSSSEEDLQFYKLSIIFTQDELSLGNATEFLRLVDDPSDWATILNENTLSTVIWKVVEQTELDLFLINARSYRTYRYEYCSISEGEALEYSL